MQDRGSSMEQSSASRSWATSAEPTSIDSPPRSGPRSADVVVPSTDDADALSERQAFAENLDDPLNRYYRYPAARGLLTIAGGLPFTPDHVTFAHTALGIGAATLVAFGSPTWLIVSAVMLEARMILDCYDGVLARAKKISSPRGRTLDELGDAVSYVALCIGMAVHVARTRPELPLSFIAPFAVLMIGIGAFSGHAYDFYKRRLGSALKSGRDAIAEELKVKHDLVARGQGAFITRFGIWFDGWQVRLYEPPYADESAVGTVVSRANDPKLRTFVRAVGILSWDNALAILHLGIIAGYVFEAELTALAYGFIMLPACLVLSRRALSARSPRA